MFVFVNQPNKTCNVQSGVFLGTPTGLNGGEHQEDTTLARVESVNLFEEAGKKLPKVSSVCLG